MTANRSSPHPAHALFATPDVIIDRRPDGALLLRSARELGSMPKATVAWLEHWGQSDPERPFLAERALDGQWRRLSYGEARTRARNIAQGLIDRRLDRARPILILAENGIDHALLALGAQYAGQPFAPVSTAYARISKDFGKIRHIATLLDPQLVYLDDAARYETALPAMGLGNAEIVASRGELPGRNVTPFSALAATANGAGVDAAFANITHDTIAKILFTSGSTGQPKGVINTQGMLVSNQESLAAIWPFLETEPPRLVDWLPWNHTFGGNHNFNLVLRNGGFMFIDEGRPAPGLIEATIANLKDVSPTIYFSVPRGIAVLLDHLERDAALQTTFFDQLRLVMSAGAALPQSLWLRMEAIMQTVVGHVLPMTTSWGATETSPLATSAHYALDRPGNIGVPTPGSLIKLVPVAGKLEIRCKGPNISPGYFKEPELTAASRDAEGWWNSGDAVRFADAGAPGNGLIFDGRTAENFKLTSGTWVNVGLLRTAVITAAAPLIDDCVLTGHDSDEIGLLIFPSLAGMRRAAPPASATASAAELIAMPEVAAALSERLRAHNATAGGSSERIGRVLLLTEPPSIDAGEITDKGYINQRMVLQRRAADVQRLTAAMADAGIIVI